MLYPLSYEGEGGRYSAPAKSGYREGGEGLEPCRGPFDAYPHVFRRVRRCRRSRPRRARTVRTRMPTSRRMPR